MPRDVVGGRLRVLYLPGRRPEWRDLLRASNRIELIELAVARDLSPLARLLHVARAATVAAATRQPDLVLAEYPGFASLGLWLARGPQPPLVVGLKGDPWREATEQAAEIPWRAWIGKLANRIAAELLLRRAEGVLAVGEPIRRTFIDHVGGSTASFVVPLPLPPRTVAAGVGDLALAAPSYLLSVTNFNFWAKVEPMLRAAPQVFEVLRSLDREWLILGDGWFLERCRRQLQPWSSRIRLLGRVDAATYRRASAVFVHVSGLDGLPNALLEAAAAGLPLVINHDYPDAARIHDAGRGALTLDFADRDAVAAALTPLLGDADRRRASGDAATAWASLRFAPPRVAAELEAALVQIHALTRRGATS